MAQPYRIDFEFFFELPNNPLITSLFQKRQPVWTGLNRIYPVCQTFFDGIKSTQSLSENFQSQTWITRDNQSETVIFVVKGFSAEKDTVFSDVQIAIGKGSSIEPGAVIKPPLIIGRKTEIRQGSYIRGGVIVGDSCTIGHSSEVKSAVLMNHSEAGHFAYIGDSIIGSHVNLGAGTRLANLRFRSLEQKQKQLFPEIDVNVGNEKLSTNLAKFGAILGDGVETGCNSVIAPGSLIGRETWIYPCVFVKGGFYPERSIVNTDTVLLTNNKK